MSSSYQTSFPVPALKYNLAHRMLLVTALMFFLKSGNETIVLVYTILMMLMMYINDHIIILYALMMIIFPSSCKPIVYFITMLVLFVVV